MGSPLHFLKSMPTEQTVTFAGEYLDLKGLAESTKLNYSYLSHIFSAHSSRMPSLAYARKLADALGMTLSDLIEALDKKKHEAA